MSGMGLARLAVRGLLICCWACCATAGAQTDEANTLPRALKDLKPSGLQCRREDPIPAGGGQSLAAPALPPPELRCALTAPDAARLLGHADVAFVDTRTAEAFESFRIAGGVNLPPHTVQTRPYWRGKQVVLLGSGKDDLDLYAYCAALRARGFTQARVLQGGMAAWVGNGLAVEGKAPPAAELMALDPAELWTQAQFDANAVLLTSASDGLEGLLPSAVTVDAGKPQWLAKALERRRRESKGASPAAAIVVVPPETLPAMLEQWRRSIAPTPLFYYAGSADALRRYLGQQKKVWQAHANGPKQPLCGR